MKVSLIVTTYENPSALKKVADSILTQTRPPDEVLIADDGSGEDTASGVKRFSENAPFPVNHIWHEHRGFRAAKIRNEAIKKSSGEYILLLDGDCMVNRHFISDHLVLAERGCFIQGKRVHVNREAVDGFNSAYIESFPTLLRMFFSGHISNVHHLLRLPACLSIKSKRLKGIKSCNMSFFKRDIVAVNGFNEDFVGWGNEDSELACRLFKYGLSKKVHPFMAICFHLWHPANKTIPDGNRRILLASLASEEYTCRNGLVKKN